MATTIKGIQRIGEIQSKRERLFRITSQASKKEAEHKEALKQMEKNVALASVGVQKATNKVKVSKMEASRKMEID